MFENIIKELVDKYLTIQVHKETILNELFENAFLKEKYVSDIRRSTTIGLIANEVFKKLGIQEQCKIMAIGDIEYYFEIKKSWQNLMKKSLKNIDLEQISGYDLNGQGSVQLSSTLFDYMNMYYNFPNLKQEITNEIIPCYGSTDGFVMILDTLRQKYNDKKINFIYPEASFGPNIKIAETYGVNLISIKKPSKNDFFIRKNQINEIYNKNTSNINLYYFTSVGNPTGEKIPENDLYDIMKHIVKLDQNCIFILDNVYVGLLKKESSYSMFKNIFEDREVFEKIVFCESLSKTLGTTGIRLAWIWTINSELRLLLKKNIVLKKAGYSKILDQLICNLLSDLDEISTFEEEVFEFIGNQRTNFMKFIESNYIKYFDLGSSSKVNDREGIYVLLKVNPGFTSEEIFAQTQIIGVSMRFSDGDYIRYSFGNTNYF